MELVTIILLCANVAGAMGALVYIAVRLMRMVEHEQILMRSSSVTDYARATGLMASEHVIDQSGPIPEPSQWGDG